MRPIPMRGMGRHASLVAVFLLPTMIAAEQVIIHDIQEAQQQFVQKEHSAAFPFLSATLKTEINSVSSFINSSRRTMLSDTLFAFLRHVFDDQQVYDVEIVGVSIFEEELERNSRKLMTVMNMNVQPRNSRGRILALNSLQADQFFFEGEDVDDDDGTDDDEAIYGESSTQNMAVNTLNETGNIAEENEDSGYDDEFDLDEVEGFFENEFEKSESVLQATDSYTLRFAAVISAEHSQQQTLTHGDFQAMLIHICHKFNNYLVEFVHGIDDEYFANVTVVLVSGYEARDTVGMTSQQVGSELSVGSIVALVFCVFGFVLFSFIAVKKFNRGGLWLKANEWRSQEIARNNATNSIKPLNILFSRPHDDYSFDPLSSDNGYNGHAIPRCYDDHTQFREESVTFEDKSSSHTSSLFNQSTIQKLDTPIRPAEKEYQHVFAPPGKVGVAIDVVDGNPIVHKVKSGSPLEGLLKPKDLVIAIDDVDTTRMSAADVTHLMVKRMNYRRKITFVRKDS